MTILTDFKQLQALADETPRDASDLHDNLREIYQALYLVDFSRYEAKEVRESAEELLRAIFHIRLDVRARIEDWRRKGLMTHPVQAALRDCFRASRYAGDMIGEIYLEHPRLAEGQSTLAAFAGPWPNVMLNSALVSGPPTFEPGDVILERGMVHNSAAISRIGDTDSQFSHVGIVARNPAGELVVVEALIEHGSVVTPLQSHLGHHIGRAMLFRHRDRQLAACAAERIHAHVASTLEAGKSPILYDFTMSLAGYDQLFCSKLVRLAYDLGSDGAVKLPPFKTLLDMSNRDFVERIGVTAKETFAPGDLELAPEFDVVAEWRDYRITSELRLKDLIMTKLFEWMELYGYRFQPDMLVRIVSLGGRMSTHLSRRAQDLVASVVAKVPPNMSASAIGAVAMLHKTAEPIYKELSLLEAETIRNSGRPLHPREVFAELERMRQRSGRRIGYLRC